MSKVSTGQDVFSEQHGNVELGGIRLSEPELDASLEHRVASALRDEASAVEVEALLTPVATTQFAVTNLRAALMQTRTLEDWQVGEALAEAYLTDHRECEFPWPMARDARNPRGSLPGTDSVGFQKHGFSYRIAFGETKTSSDKTRPPQVWNGRSGLKKQLEDLRDSTAIKGHLVVRYLGVRAKGTTWETTYKAAAARYLADPTDVALFGVLVRDTEPHIEDARARAKALANGCPKLTVIGILVLYLPVAAIANLAAKVATIDERRRA